MYVCVEVMSFVPDGVVIVDSDEEIMIENSEPFIPTNEWQEIKPGEDICVSHSGLWLFTPAYI